MKKELFVLVREFSSRIFIALAFFLLIFLIFPSPTLAEINTLDSVKEKIIPNYFDCPCPHLIAHRGASGSYPDSSLLAFEKALELHTDILELDVHLSKDKKIVVSHDASLLRTTGKNLEISETNLKKIKKADAGYTFQSKLGDFPYRDKGLSTLTLKELVAAFPNARFNIEIKPNDPELAKSLKKFVTKNKLSERVVVASKHAYALDSYRTTKSTVSMTSSHLNDIMWAYIYWALNLDMKNTNYELLQLPYQFVNKSLVDYFHEQNKKVHVWTVNNEQDMRDMLQIGVDGVMTDYPELAYPIFVELGLR